MRRGNRHQLFGLAGDRAVLEHGFIEVKKALHHIGGHLAKFFVLFRAVLDA